MNSLYRNFHRIAWFCVTLCVLVIALGGYTRLNNAGLSCPDWPTCYGQITWPKDAHEIAAANNQFERAVDVGKAKLEQVHRHLAATLGGLVLLLALIAVRKRPNGVWQVLFGAALVAASIPFYIKGMIFVSGLLAFLGQLQLFILAWRWNNSDHARIAVIILFVIVFQALLGMWTVVWLVKPIVVMAHLLGGLTSLALILTMAWWASPGSAIRHADAQKLRLLLWIGLAVLGVQIALGGWTSANYAAMACGLDFPKCLGTWWPQTDFRQAFVLWRGVGVDYEGGVLDGAARAAIHLTHRLFAIVAVIVLATLAWRLWRSPGFRRFATALTVLLILQIGLGIANVMLALPLMVAMAHLLVAVLIIMVIISMLARVQRLEH